MDEINLNTIPALSEKFDVLVGLSDHTMNNEVAVASVAPEAKIIEKHFILDRNMGGPDAEFSMEPHEFKQMVDAIRNVEKALGNDTFEVTEKMKINQDFSRSLFVVEDIKKGDIITEENVRSIRPGFGLHTKYLKDILGKKVNTDLKKGTPFELEFV